MDHNDPARFDAEQDAADNRPTLADAATTGPAPRGSWGVDVTADRRPLWGVTYRLHGDVVRWQVRGASVTTVRAQFAAKDDVTVEALS